MAPRLDAMTPANPLPRMSAAILVDVDGTLVGPYLHGRRELRASAARALEMLSEVAPVFLWSIVGPENGTRLLEEFPHLRRYISGCYGKQEFPLASVDRPYAIDDESVDDRVMCCRHYLLDTSYCGGSEGDDLLRAAMEVVADMRGIPELH